MTKRLPRHRRQGIFEGNLWQNPRFRSLAYQSMLVVGCVGLGWLLADNAITNMQARGLKSGFDFLAEPTGFTVSQAPIEYTPRSSYFRVFLVGVINTAIVSAIGIVLATIIGFFVGIMRMSHNWLIAKIATVYVEIIRNVPLLLQIFLVYYATLLPLPRPTESFDRGDVMWFSVTNGGVQLPEFVFGSGMRWVFLALFAGIAVSIYLWRRSKRIQRKTGRQVRIWPYVLGMILVLPVAVFFLTGRPLDFEPATMGRFRIQGGLIILPELMALVIALSVYTASFIAEVVRAGLQSVHRGQLEASRSLGLSEGQTVRLVTVPQAMRVIIPPLTNQYLNLTKNSSLAAAIAYPELVSVFAGTALNQSGRVFEILGMTLMTYLTLSILTSALMNWYNARMRLVER